MTKPNQVRPIMKIVNQVRELIIDAHNAGKAAGRKGLLKELEENIELHYPAVAKDELIRVMIYLNKWEDEP